MSADESRLFALADSAAGLSLDAVPAAARRHSALVFADTVGVMMGGAQVPEIGRLVASRHSTAGQSEILAPGLPCSSPEEAAFINATAGTFLELDQGVRPTGHPAIHVVPAALAAAQALHSTGAELLGAIIAGCEVTTRLFEAFQLRYPVHPHGHLGAIGAAVAVARIQGRPAGPAAAIASTLPLLTVWEPCFEGATARNAWTGVAAEIGIKSNRLSDAGFTGSQRALRVSFGEVVGKQRRVDVLAEPITAGDLRSSNDYLKLHSACALTHAALDAVLELRPDPAEVDGIVVETISNNMKLDRQAAENSLSTRFSLPYAVAATIVHGHTRPDAFIYARHVAELARRVVIREAPDLERLWPDKAPARVTVRTRSGTRTAQVDNPRGHYANPANEAELRAKFVGLSWDVESAALYDRLVEVSSVADCADLFRH